MNNKEKKVNHFLYVSSTLSIILGGYSLVQNDYVDTIAYIGLSSGLYAIANSLSVEKDKYVKNLKLYEDMTKIATLSCILIPDYPYEPIPIIISLFVGGNMLLFSKIYENERKHIK